MIIGLVGQKRVGKTSFSDYLKTKYNFLDIAFADPIKEGIKIMFDLTDEQVNGNLKEVIDDRWGFTPREFLQIIGTDACRKLIDDDIWIKRLKIELDKQKKSNIVISDIRFPNEAKEVKKMGGILIKITNSNIQLTKSSLHISEQLIEQINYDYHIENNDSIQNYYNNIDKLITKIKRIHRL